jgi:hypothetical protein
MPGKARRLRLPDILDNRHMNVARLSVLSAGLLYPPGDVQWPMKNLNDPIGERSRDLPAFSTVPQPSAPPRTLYQ